MAISIHFINTRGIYHRDLKPENFLITKSNGNKVYLHMHDFGIARALESSVRHVTTDSGIVKGSTHYCSPEQLRGTSGQCLEKIDTWAMGVIAYQLVARKFPFDGYLSAHVIYAITMTQAEPLTDEKYPGYSHQLRNLIMSLLSRNHMERPSIE